MTSTLCKIALAASLSFGTFCYADIHYHLSQCDEEDLQEEEDVEDDDLSDECSGCQFYSFDAYYFNGHYPSYIEEMEHDTVSWPGRRSDPFGN